MNRRDQVLVSKSAAIRAIRQIYPADKPADLAVKLKLQGYPTMTAGYVSSVLSLDKHKTAVQPEAGPVRRKLPAAGVEQLIMVKRFADRVGGVEKACRAMDALAKLLA